MAGRGPAPKRGVKLGHGARQPTRAGRPPTAAAEPRRQCPPGEWHHQARAWWDGMAASLAAGRWELSDWLLAHRGLAIVDRWWRLVDDGKDAEATRIHAELRHVETALQVTPVERARAGIYPAAAPPPAASGARSRARLRAIDGRQAEK